MWIVGLVLAYSCSTDHPPIDGKDLWFTNNEIHPNCKKLALPTYLYFSSDTEMGKIITEELLFGLEQLSGNQVLVSKRIQDNSLILLTPESKVFERYVINEDTNNLGEEGFLIKRIPEQNTIVIVSNTENGLLYGIYSFLRILKTGKIFEKSFVHKETPKFKIRILNHWDNLDGSVERGYAGHSIWRWDELPAQVSHKYKAYARANASIGINGTVLNNVNANPQFLTTHNLAKVKVIADELRPYGMQVFMSVNFASPQIIGQLSTAHPHNDSVRIWWAHKVKEIYELVPDFGGFLVKANSEGQPGPMDYGCSHSDGANLLAEVLEPHGGIVMWRAFVYEPKGDDRAMEAYNEFKPLDGAFHKNVIVQVKNGPIDFQPREPYSPLFGAMKQTTLMPELQITQEYLGFSAHLVFLAPLYTEFLNTETYSTDSGATVAEVCDGTIFNGNHTAIAGVANIGNAINWCGHHFAQANWYAFGRLAWDHSLTSTEIANEWLCQTFTSDSVFVHSLTDLMLRSREVTISYMTPLGLHHLMGWDHHHGPEPWCDIPNARPDWLPKYYHRADFEGVGFDRTSDGSNAISQYYEPYRSQLNNIETCPENLLLWFHHADWNHTMKSNNTLWDELCYKYDSGVKEVQDFQTIWAGVKNKMEAQRWNEVNDKLTIQFKEAQWWRDACLLYFQEYSNQPFPNDINIQDISLEELKEYKFNMTHQSNGF